MPTRNRWTRWLQARETARRRIGARRLGQEGGRWISALGGRSLGRTLCVRARARRGEVRCRDRWRVHVRNAT